MSDSGRSSGIGIYDFATATTTELNADEASAAKWLSDSRRVVYFAKKGVELVMLDTVTRTRTVIDVRLPAPAVIDRVVRDQPRQPDNLLRRGARGGRHLDRGARGHPDPESLIADLRNDPDARLKAHPAYWTRPRYLSSQPTIS